MGQMGWKDKAHARTAPPMHARTRTMRVHLLFRTHERIVALQVTALQLECAQSGLRVQHMLPPVLPLVLGATVVGAGLVAVGRRGLRAAGGFQIRGCGGQHQPSDDVAARLLQAEGREDRLNLGVGAARRI